MIKYIILRILWIIPVMIGVVFIVFTISYITPEDPVEAILGTGYTQEAYDRKAKEIGVDKSYLEQLGRYIWNLATKFDLGKAFGSSIPISYELKNRVPVTFKLSLYALIFMVIIGFPLGILSAVKQYSFIDAALTSFAMITSAIPSFILAMLGAVVFAVTLRVLPLTGLDTWQAWIMPVLCPAFGGIATFLRMTRTTMLEVIRQDYIRTARAKGLRESTIIWRHALRNCLIILTTVFGTFMATLLSGSIIVETIFAIPGMGMYMMSGIIACDYPIINGVVVIISFFVCVINLVIDILIAFIDPRIKAQLISPKRAEKAIRMLREAKESQA